MQKRLSVLILAAGAGTRMKSALPKVLHPLGGVPMVLRVLRAVQGLKPASVALILGHGGREIAREVRRSFKTDVVWQKTQAGSGHAVRCSSGWISRTLRRSKDLLVLCGDTPLIAGDTLKGLWARHRAQGAGATILTAEVADPFGYGRIVRDTSDGVRGIVEEKDATPEERRIREINSGIYCFDSKSLLRLLPRLKNDNAKREYYLTDVIGLMSAEGLPVGAHKIGGEDAHQILGVNSRRDLAEAEEILQGRIRARWMAEGVTILNPATVRIGENVRIGPDTVILPGTILEGGTRVGRGCRLGPWTWIEDSSLGDGAEVKASFVHSSRVGAGVKVGPFSHLRKGSDLAEGARVGNFSETKNSRIGRGAKVNHLSYIGDAALGEGVNVGAGTITCNYDGKLKHRTRIGRGAFIGSNTNLVAPVSVGAGAVVGAGSTITRDVPGNALALARPQQVVKKDWAKRKRS